MSDADAATTPAHYCIYVQVRLRQSDYISDRSFASANHDLKRVMKESEEEEVARLISLLNVTQRTNRAIRSAVAKVLESQPAFYYERIHYGSPLTLDLLPSVAALAFLVWLLRRAEKVFDQTVGKSLEKAWADTEASKRFEKAVTTNLDSLLKNEGKKTIEAASARATRYIERERDSQVRGIFLGRLNLRTTLGPFAIEGIETILPEDQGVAPVATLVFGGLHTASVIKVDLARRQSSKSMPRLDDAFLRVASIPG